MQEKAIKDFYKITVSGDSISRGVIYDEQKNKYSLLKDNYVNLSGLKLKGTIQNISKFGNTITRGCNRLEQYITKETPDIVLIEYGGNDCDFNWDEVADNPSAGHSPKTEADTFENYLRRIILELKEINITPVLMTLPPLNADMYFEWISRKNQIMKENILKWLGSVTRIYWWQEKYSSAILRVSEETHTNLIDARSAFLGYADYRNLLCIDGIHPNKEGHRVIAEKIMNYIKSDYAYLSV
jgi:acyl-CoA thioesterase I